MGHPCMAQHAQVRIPVPQRLLQTILPHRKPPHQLQHRRRRRHHNLPHRKPRPQPQPQHRRRRHRLTEPQRLLKALAAQSTNSASQLQFPRGRWPQQTGRAALDLHPNPPPSKTAPTLKTATKSKRHPHLKLMFRTVISV